MRDLYIKESLFQRWISLKKTLNYF